MIDKISFGVGYGGNSLPDGLHDLGVGYLSSSPGGDGMSYTDSEQILKNSKLWTDSEFFSVSDAVRVINSIRKMDVKKNSTAQMLSRMVQNGELDKPEKKQIHQKKSKP